MNLYEVLAPGYQSPVTKTEIAQLFRAGHLARDHRCKQLAQKEWRTIDELFPLLKYQSVAFDYDEPLEPGDHSVRTWHLILGLVVAMSALAALWYYFANDSTSPAPSRAPVAEIRWPRANTTVSSPPAVIASQPSAQPARASEQSTWSASQPELPNIASTTEPQPVDQRRQAAAHQRLQAEQTRLLEERARQEEKAHGQDTLIPLDQDCLVKVGGLSVMVKIHDNDVTSFDVWINGSHRREVRKEKGITQSRTDETPIYGNGRARLYYVWEISGKVNHCRLRVREG